MEFQPGGTQRHSVVRVAPGEPTTLLLNAALRCPYELHAPAVSREAARLQRDAACRIEGADLGSGSPGGAWAVDAAHPQRRDHAAETAGPALRETLSLEM